MSRRIHGLFLPLVFPAGLAPGDGGDYNTLTVARDGQRRPVLRGTAVAGALRQAWRKQGRRRGLSPVERDAEVTRYFGCALGDDDAAGGVESPLQVADCVLNLGHVKDPLIRTHHQRNRHTGTVVDGGLFSLEACPPGTSTTVACWFRDDLDEPDSARAFLRTLVEFVRAGLVLGGKAARGLGIAQLRGEPTYRAYQLDDAKDHAQWLDDHRAWRMNPECLPASQPLASDALDSAGVLQVCFVLGIPRGQDLLIGEGQGLKHDVEPQRVRAADGSLLWRLPGASLRGLFRGWVNRLAARAGQPVADSTARHVKHDRQYWRGELPEPAAKDPQTLTGDNLGWCFLPGEQRRPSTARTECPVARLFGSLFQAGRIHVADAYAPCSVTSDQQTPAEEQLRKHVAVDRITGGAAESLLFENTVLTAYDGGRAPRFKVMLWVHEPSEQEARWLAQALHALDVGILRVGSSKSSGRLALLEPPDASGPGKEFFNQLQPAESPG